MRVAREGVGEEAEVRKEPLAPVLQAPSEGGLRERLLRASQAGPPPPREYR